MVGSPLARDRAGLRAPLPDGITRCTCLNPPVHGHPRSQWLAGARPRTLPAAVAPVLAGTGVAAYADAAVWWKAPLALVVSLALQVGVNYANDYSDGIRGTDDDRVGPMRLVGSGLATPRAVKTRGVRRVRRRRGRRAGARGDDGLVAGRGRRWSASWPPGSTPAARKPYGYLGLGEVMVFVFFGLVAVIGHDVRPDRDAVELAALYAAVGIGALACAILVANNLRDIPTDREVGQAHAGGDAGRGAHPRTSTRCWSPRPWSRWSASRSATTWWALLGLAFLVPAIAAPPRAVLGGATGPGLVPVLQQTGIAELLYGARPVRRPADRLFVETLSSGASGRTLNSMWFLILLALVAVGFVAYSMRVPIAGQDPRPARVTHPPSAQGQGLTRPPHHAGREHWTSSQATRSQPLAGVAARVCSQADHAAGVVSASGIRVLPTRKLPLRDPGFGVSPCREGAATPQNQDEGSTQAPVSANFSSVTRYGAMSMSCSASQESE